MRLPVVALAIVCFSAVAARADTVYTYTGAYYAGARGAYTTSERLTGSITLAAPLAANLNHSVTTLTSFFFNDGVNSYAPFNSNPGFTYFYFSTDANGTITGFTFQIYEGGIPAQIAANIEASSYQHITTVYARDISSSAAGDGGSFSSGVSTVVAVTPEPSSLALLGTGMLSAFGLVKRRLS